MLLVLLLAFEFCQCGQTLETSRNKDVNETLNFVPNVSEGLPKTSHL